MRGDRAGTAPGAEYASALGLTLASPQTTITLAAVFAAGGLTLAEAAGPPQP